MLFRSSSDARTHQLYQGSKLVPCMGFKPMISTLERRVCLIATPTRDILIGRPRGDRTHDKRIKSPLLYQLSYRSISGGRSGIRTHGRLSPTSVFKTGALNHSATLPLFGRRCRIRTCDPLLPKQMRYQTALRSAVAEAPLATQALRPQRAKPCRAQRLKKGCLTVSPGAMPSLAARPPLISSTARAGP